MKQKIAFKKWIQIVAVLVASSSLAVAAFGDSPVTVSLDPKAPEPAIPDGFSGLSYEMALVLPGPDGKYYFSAENKPLINMFHTLGVKTLRVGGNTADRPTVKVPAPADLDKLFAFVKAADVKVIFTLRLRESNPAEAVKVAKYVMDHYKSYVICFAIGNEPNIFATTYPVYRAELDKYMAAIIAVAPDAKFCGPSTTPGKAEWARQLAKDLGKSGRIALITQHDYPGASARKVTDVAVGRDKMLSTDWIKYNEKFFKSFAPDAMSNGLPYRLEEANSFYNGGAKDVSDTFASAIWGLDYLHWWASHGANGINFHTGDSVAAGEENTPCRYAIFWTAADGYLVHPMGYAMKTFDLGSHGQRVPAEITSNADKLNLTAYGVLGTDKNLYVTLINKEHGSGAHDAKVDIAVGEGFAGADIIALTSPQGDVSLTSGTTLGGAEIKNDASWKGAWTPLGKFPEAGHFNVELPAASAVVVRLNSK